MKSFYIHDILDLETEEKSESVEESQQKKMSRKEIKTGNYDELLSLDGNKTKLEEKVLGMTELKRSKEQKSAGWRNKFSQQQRKSLEESFKTQKYLSVKQRNKLAKEIELSSEQVKTWYQNRRTRWRRNQTAKNSEVFWKAHANLCSNQCMQLLEEESGKLQYLPGYKRFGVYKKRL